MGSLAINAGSVEVLLMDDDRICGKVREHGSFEPDTLAAWCEMCKPGLEVLDVGSYSGLFAIAAAKLAARPVAIEPLPVMVRRIKDNAELNGVTFPVIEAAASNNTGRARLGVNERVRLTAGASLERKSGLGINVKTVRLDELPVMDVAVIKIDVERHEQSVIRGARNLIRRRRPKLVIETLTKEAREAVKAQLADYREVAFLDGRNLVLEPR